MIAFLRRALCWFAHVHRHLVIPDQNGHPAFWRCSACGLDWKDGEL